MDDSKQAAVDSWDRGRFHGFLRSFGPLRMAYRAAAGGLAGRDSNGATPTKPLRQPAAANQNWFGEGAMQRRRIVLDGAMHVCCVRLKVDDRFFVACGGWGHRLAYGQLGFLHLPNPTFPWFSP